MSKIRHIALAIAGAAADSVDGDARFPDEAFSALRQEKLLAAAIPCGLGGLGSSVPEIASMCTALGEHCSSTGLIFAMHQIQVFSLVRHAADSPFFSKYLRELAEKQWLIASATSEVGTGGDIRSSIAAVESQGETFRLKKRCSAVSYGKQADAILVTARRGPEAAPGEQVMALVTKDDYQLGDWGTWDTLGMRGTCSPAVTITAEGRCEQIVAEPFRLVASQTMVPYSHILWSATWLGIAHGAVATAQSFIRESAKKDPGKVSVSSTRLADIVSKLEVMSAAVKQAAQEYSDLLQQPGNQSLPAGISYLMRMNALKLSCSQLVCEICLGCMDLCGLTGYSNTSKYALGRYVRDALSAPLMIGNDRLRATNAALLLATGPARP